MKYSVNKDFFKEWSHDMAYVLGVVVSDGCIQDYQLRIGVSDKDSQWLKDIRSLIGSTHPIYERNDGISLLCIGSKELVDDLKNLGVIKNKTYDMTDIDIPVEYLNSFVLGFFDGDGNVTINTQKHRCEHKAIVISFVAHSEEFLKLLQEKINMSIKLDRGGVSYNHRSYILRYSGNRISRVVADWMYTDSHICLERKKNKIYNHLSSLL